MGRAGEARGGGRPCCGTESCPSRFPRFPRSPLLALAAALSFATPAALSFAATAALSFTATAALSFAIPAAFSFSIPAALTFATPAALAAQLAPAGAAENRDAATTVIIVRHAERAPGDQDPHLSEAGAARARTLAWMLENVGVTALYSTDLRRTRQTLAPLAERSGLPVSTYDARPGASGQGTSFEAFAARVLGDHPGGVVVIAGHSNTVAPLVSAFGGAGVLPLSETEYDHLFVLSIAEGGKVSLLKMRFATATSTTAY